MQNEKIWENLGDVNFVAYGGCLVKPHYSEEELSKCVSRETMKYTYDVFYLNPEYGESDNLMNYAALCVVDLTDSWLDYDGMLQYIGEDSRIGSSLQELLENGISPELLAKELVEYHGVGNFSPVVAKEGKLIQYPYDWQDFIVSDTDLYKWLADIGASEHIPNEENV